MLEVGSCPATRAQCPVSNRGICCSFAGALQLDDVAATIAGRAVELKSLVSKGAKARKKMAVTALLAAMANLGVAKRRSAVPASERAVQSWFRQVSSRLHRC